MGGFPPENPRDEAVAAISAAFQVAPDCYLDEPLEDPERSYLLLRPRDAWHELGLALIYVLRMIQPRSSRDLELTQLLFFLCPGRKELAGLVRAQGMAPDEAVVRALMEQSAAWLDPSRVDYLNEFSAEHAAAILKWLAAIGTSGLIEPFTDSDELRMGAIAFWRMREEQLLAGQGAKASMPKTKRRR